MSEVVFVYGDPNGPHPSHKEFINVINADTLHVYFGQWGGRVKRGLLALKCCLKYPEYKYYILESSLTVLPFAIKKFIENEKKLIGFFCDDSICNFNNRRPHYSWIDIIAHKWAFRYLDAVIAVSPMIKDEVARLLKIPVEVARPYITDENYINLARVNPNLESKNVILVGTARKNHGADILIKAFKIISEKYSNFDLKLIIGGKGWPEKWQSEKVSIPGYIKDLSEFFKDASLFVYPAWGAAYPVATLESMRAGVPVIVSTYTGTKEIAEIVGNKFKSEFGKDAKLIVKPEPLDVCRSILWYYNLEIDEKLFLSETYRKLTDRFHSKKCAEDFKIAFEKIISSI